MPPQRIISLVPSQTESMVDLGLDRALVGITKFCIHPADTRKNKAIVGGTKTLDFDKIQALRPDLIFLSSEPFPFSAKHLGEFQAICLSMRVMVVDGELFSWYGSRLLRSSAYFQNLRNEISRQPSLLPIFISLTQMEPTPTPIT